MKKFIGLLAIALIGMYSCSDDEEEVVESFSLEVDGESYTLNSTDDSFYYYESFLSDDYTVSAHLTDSITCSIVIPKLEVGIYNSANDSSSAYIRYSTSSDTYYSYYGEDSDYTIEITSYDANEGILEGTFSGVLGDYIYFSEDHEYVTVTKGKFAARYLYSID